MKFLHFQKKIMTNVQRLTIGYIPENCNYINALNIK